MTQNGPGHTKENHHMIRRWGLGPKESAWPPRRGRGLGMKSNHMADDSSTLHNETPVKLWTRTLGWACRVVALGGWNIQRTWQLHMGTLPGPVHRCVWPFLWAPFHYLTSVLPRFPCLVLANYLACEEQWDPSNLLCCESVSEELEPAVVSSVRVVSCRKFFQTVQCGHTPLK